MMRKTYQIAGVLLQIEADRDYLLSTMKEFEVIDKSDGLHINLIIKQGDLDKQPEKCLVKTNEIDIYESEQGYLMRYNLSKSVVCCLVEKDWDKAVIYVREHFEDGLDIQYAIRNVFFYFLQKYERTVIHSASIIYREKVWLFSAPSGTGKSSHVDFWRKCRFPFQDFNGDIAICYIDKNGEAVASGSPWSGTSGIYCNLVIPLGGVIFLKRGEENNVEPLDEFDGILQLTARSMTPNWSKECMSKSIHIAEQLASKIKLGIMTCTYDKEAAFASKNFIDKYS